MIKIPHVIPYQGSKRKLAEQIFSYIHADNVATFYEPFAGSAAITLAAAARNMADRYVIGDKLDALAGLWRIIIDEPDTLIQEYTCYWNEQLDDPKNYYLKLREYFNQTQSPTALFYLIARCVKNSIRFNPDGKFNQSPDNRRLGMHPGKLATEVLAASRLLKGKTEVVSGDFRETIREAKPKDLIYFDPPWGGLTENPRYAYLLDYETLIAELTRLNQQEIPFLLSFDGTCGDRSYFQELPQHLGLKRVFLDAGRSTQATLLGRNEVTLESLYISPFLREKGTKASIRPVNSLNFEQLSLFQMSEATA
jgi:DNA adenine methylase